MKHVRERGRLVWNAKDSSSPQALVVKWDRGKNTVINEVTNSCSLKGLNISNSHLAQVFLSSLYLAAGWEVVGGGKEKETLWSRIRSRLIVKQCVDLGSLLFLFSAFLEKHWGSLGSRPGGGGRCQMCWMFYFHFLILSPSSPWGSGCRHFSDTDMVQRDEITCSWGELELSPIRFQDPGSQKNIELDLVFEFQRFKLKLTEGWGKASVPWVYFKCSFSLRQALVVSKERGHIYKYQGYLWRTFKNWSVWVIWGWQEALWGIGGGQSQAFFTASLFLGWCGKCTCYLFTK